MTNKPNDSGKPSSIGSSLRDKLASLTPGNRGDTLSSVPPATAGSAAPRPSPPPPSGRVPLPNPFGTRRIEYNTRALYEPLILFDLNQARGFSELLRLVRHPKLLASMDSVLNALDGDREKREVIVNALNAQWKAFDLRGAIMVYRWRSEVQAAIQDQAKHRSVQQIEAVTDPMLLLNILGRSRTHLLLPGAPLSLDRGQLSRGLLINDTRVAAWAHEKGSMPYTSKAPPGDDEDDD